MVILLLAKRPASGNRASARSTGHASQAAGFGSNSFQKEASEVYDGK